MYLSESALKLLQMAGPTLPKMEPRTATRTFCEIFLPIFEMAIEEISYTIAPSLCIGGFTVDPALGLSLFPVFTYRQVCNLNKADDFPRFRMVRITYSFTQNLQWFEIRV